MAYDDQGAIPPGFEDEVWKEWADLLAAGGHLEVPSARVTEFESLIHPLAEAFVGTYDVAQVRLDHDLPAEVRQFCHCLSQVVTGRLMEMDAIAALPTEVYAALAFSAIAGWQAARAENRGELDLPQP